MKQEVRNVGKFSASTPSSGSNYLLYSSVESFEKERQCSSCKNLANLLTNACINDYENSKVRFSGS